MNRLPKLAIILSLIKALQEKKSGCGETNIQKACYFLQELMGVPLGLNFILYKYGPYSFDLTDELTAMRANSLLDLQVREPGYGPCYVPSESSDLVLDQYPKTVERVRDEVNFVAERLGDKRVAELERLSTALYVRKNNLADDDKRADKIVELKPHISRADALAAVETVDKMFEEVQQTVGA